MFIIYVIDLSTQKRWKDGVHIFTKIKNTDCWKKKKIYFSVILFQEFLFFSIWPLSENFNVSSEHSFKVIKYGYEIFQTVLSLKCKII